MHSISIALVLFLLTSSFAFGQSMDTKSAEPPYIEVVGTSEREVVPDEIYLRIILRERYVNKVKITIEEQEEKLKVAIKSLGIELKNLSLTDANADYVKVRWQKKDVVTAKDYTLKVSTATTVGEVFQELEKLEISDASILKVTHSKIDSLRKEVRILAIKAAKEKAEYLLTAINERPGVPLIIRETETHPVSNISGYPANTRGGIYEAESYIDGVKMRLGVNDEIQFRKIKIQSSIYVKYSIHAK